MAVDQVKKIGGTNPLLLSKLQGTDNEEEYSRRVEKEVKSFLTDNLSVMVDPTTAAQFFDFYKWDTGRLYILLALQCKTFTDTQLKQYKDTWLHDNHILIEKVDGTMKFNFPSLGECLVQSMRVLLPNIPRVQELAHKNPTVAGPVCEKVLIDYIQRNSQLQVIINSLCVQQQQKHSGIKLCLNGVLHFEGEDLLEGVIYELYNCHPAIDFVGYIPSKSGSKYLVFIQISLSSYVNHESKFEHILTTVPKKELLKPTDVQVNLLTYYSSRSTCHHSSSEKVNVLLLYVSPKEKTSLIERLQHRLRSTYNQYSHSFNFYVGVVSTNSIKPIFGVYSNQ